ncbi:MAG: DNA polymerase III subunit delta' [Deltaproteobacteria bacterium]|nr:DNA polymerase III subunit delta' [Deltaproteobacteria bacterium]
MSFKNISGHEKQIAMLKSAMAKEHLPHALLFYGIKGIGKRTTALGFAKALNCVNGNTDACDACISCRKTDHGNHPDVVTVQADGQFIKINAIREIQARMKFRPLEGKKRIFLIIDADKMNGIAANALLKTIEEPSPANILILVTSVPHQLPPTVLSRCQHLRFNPLPDETVALFLQERLSLDAVQAQTLAASSGGSIGKALEMNEESFLDSRKRIIAHLSDSDWTDPAKLLSFLGDFGEERHDILGKLDVLRSCFRDALVYKETGEKGRMVNSDCMEFIGSVAGRLSGQNILNAISAMEKARGAIELNANKSLTLETMMFKVISCTTLAGDESH